MKTGHAGDTVCGVLVWYHAYSCLFVWVGGWVGGRGACLERREAGHVDTKAKEAARA